MQIATFGLGCFWSPDAQFGAIPGVIRTRVGYTGGSTLSPSYEEPGDHSEAIQLEYDPRLVSYRQLLQEAVSAGGFGGKPLKRQYRSVVFYHNAEQRAEAQAAGLTELEAAGIFTRAEDYHQKHFLQHGPEGQEFLARYNNHDAFTDATETARANAIASGRLTYEQILALLPSLGVSSQTRQLLLEHAKKA
jgi:peptide-methionine (S)-S-oxide reductase